MRRDLQAALAVYDKIIDLDIEDVKNYIASHEVTKNDKSGQS